MKLKSVIKSDLLRYSKYACYSGFFLKYLYFLYLLFVDLGFRAIFIYRICSKIKEKRSKSSYPFYVILYWAHICYTRKRGIQLPIETKIDKGLRIMHPFDIVINPETKIGANCTIFNGVTIGRVRGKLGLPEIGNNVVISAGAKVIGNVKIGNNVMIGANAVVVRDVPNNATVGGIPAEIINYEGEKHTNLYI